MRLNYHNTILTYFLFFLLFPIKVNAATINPITMPLDSLISWVEENVQQLVDTEETKESYHYAYIALRRAKEIGDYNSKYWLDTTNNTGRTRFKMA